MVLLLCYFSEFTLSICVWRWSRKSLCRSRWCFRWGCRGVESKRGLSCDF